MNKKSNLRFLMIYKFKKLKCDSALWNIITVMP